MTPITLLVDTDGTEVDWIGAYEHPSDQFVAKLDKATKGIDTATALMERYAKNPKDAEAVFKLALKFEDKLDDDKALEKWKEGVALDPEGKTGTFITDFEKLRVSYSDYAAHTIAREESAAGKKPNLEPIKNFLQKYPDSELRMRAHMNLASLMSTGPKDEAMRFYDDLAKKYPLDTSALDSYLRFIVRSRRTIDRGKEVAARLLKKNVHKSDLEGYYQQPWAEERRRRRGGKAHIRSKKSPATPFPLTF